MGGVILLGISLSRQQETEDANTAWSVSVRYRITDHSVLDPCGWPSNNEKQISKHGLSREEAIKSAERLAAIIEGKRHWWNEW